MNPLLLEALGSIMRWLLAGAAGWLVQHGIWTQAQSQTYVMAAALAVLSLGWSLWQKYKSRIHFLTALELPAGSDEGAVKAKIANGTGAPLVVLFLAAVLGAGVMVSSCASFRALPLADQVRLELDAAEWGVKADHDFGTNWLSDADVAVFQHVDDTVRQVLATNPPNVKAAARAAAVIELGKLPADSKVRPYVNGLVDALA
jgi:hypothetical protein